MDLIEFEMIQHLPKEKRTEEVKKKIMAGLTSIFFIINNLKVEAMFPNCKHFNKVVQRTSVL